MPANINKQAIKVIDIIETLIFTQDIINFQTIYNALFHNFLFINDQSNCLFKHPPNLSEIRQKWKILTFVKNFRSQRISLRLAHPIKGSVLYR